MKKVIRDKLKNKKTPLILKRHTLKVALCAIGRREEDYLKEWVEHYKSIGFDNIIFYDNNDEGDDGQYTILKQYIDDGFVIYHDYRKLHNNKQQKTSYKHAFSKYREEYDWIAFFDVDEFLYLKDYKTIKNFLNSNEKFNHFDSIHFRWVDYTDSGLLYSDKRGVKERFIEIYNGVPFANNIKSIVKTKNIKEIKKISVHTLDIANCCNAKGENIENLRRISEICDNAYIKHYRFKSLEEYIKRYYNGSANGRRKSVKLLYYIKENKYTYEKHKILCDKGILQDCLKNEIISKLQKSGLKINLDEPKTVLDKLNYLKVYDITKEKSMCADKIYLHEYSKKKIR